MDETSRQARSVKALATWDEDIQMHWMSWENLQSYFTGAQLAGVPAYYQCERCGSLNQVLDLHLPIPRSCTTCGKRTFGFDILFF